MKIRAESLINESLIKKKVHWAIRSSARTANSFAFSALLASLARSAALIHSLACSAALIRSLACSLTRSRVESHATRRLKTCHCHVALDHDPTKLHLYRICLFFRPLVHFPLLGFGPEGGRSPVEHRGNLSIRPSIPPSPRPYRGWFGLSGLSGASSGL